MKKNLKIMFLCVVFLAVSVTQLLAVDEISYPFEGVTYIHRKLTSPRLLDINIVIIDLKAEGISFKVSPDNGPAPADVDRQTTRAFLTQENAQIAINGSFFYVGNGTDILGFAASEGYFYSPFESRFHYPTPHCALNLSQDNVADIIRPCPGIPTGYRYYPFDVNVYNALMGSEWIVQDGVKVVSTTLDINVGKHPRTAAGITDDDKLILFVVDGRQAGHSLGMYTYEVADMLMSLGATNAINLDGGGSSTLVFADPVARVVNRPSDGSERAVGNSLAVFATYVEPELDRLVFADFENGDENNFYLSPGYSGSTEGIIKTQSTADAVQGIAKSGDWSQKIVIKDDPDVLNSTDYPQYGWMVRHVSGPHASAAENIARPSQGFLGYWAKTSTQGLAASIVIDDGSQMERGILVAVIPDGQWHYYEWNLEDNTQWNGWLNGNGNIDSAYFTIDSIQLFGPNADAQLYIDKVMHNPFESILTPYTCEEVWENGLGLAGDFNKDCFVEIADLVLLADHWLESESSLNECSFNGDSIIDVADFCDLSGNWQKNNMPQVD